MNQPLRDRLQEIGYVPTMERATRTVRVFVEHVGEAHGHNLLPWTYDRHGVARCRCQLCGSEAQVFYRSNREARYAHTLQEPCAGARSHRFAAH